MTSKTQEELYQNFLTVSGQQTQALGNATATLADVIAQVGAQQSNSQTTATANQAQAAAQTGSSSGGSTAGSVGTRILEAGLGLPMLIAGLFGIFGGGDNSAPAPLVKYAMPAKVDFQAAESQGQVSGLDYDQTGLPRTFTPAGTSGATRGGASGGASGSGNSGSAAPQITFNVQAMDARSFMDRSGDIALAVRDAMLNLNSINDVVNDL
jgi:hypothetical protein